MSKFSLNFTCVPHQRLNPHNFHHALYAAWMLRRLLP